MTSMTPLRWVGIGLGMILALYSIFHFFPYFADGTVLGGILLLELIVVCLWKYDERFYLLVLIAFAWAGMNLPMESAWMIARWVVLFAGALVGFIVWTKTPRAPFGSLHLIAFFCVCAAFVSATVSPLTRTASLKALSLLLLFLYCASGGRLAVLRREDRFFHGLLLGCEITTYLTVFCYFGLGMAIWGNPNSLGVAMSVGVFPILFWGWLISDGPVVKFRRLVSLLLCAYLILFSGARSGMVAAVAATLTFCLCLHQYKLLVKVTALALLLVAVGGVFAPETLNQRLSGLMDIVLYKGHKKEGLLGSRRTPWEESIASIKAHPFFGTGYGTSPTGEDYGLEVGELVSSEQSTREHGNSYMTIAEWVGLLGVLPFVALLGVTLSHIWKVCAWMNRTCDPHHYSVPLAMVALAGLVHASFEDWLFAAGYYVCVYFWIFAFLLADLAPQAVAAPTPGVIAWNSRTAPASFGAAVPNR
ncbi:MAG: O-antigen ligase family protein [Terriglobales bacterium]